jgi:predicted signal transduction protein with EAL and GGDEF domain
MAPNDAKDLAEELLRYADIALYEAKEGGRNTWRFYAGDMNARGLLSGANWKADLRQAIKHGELRLDFQPRYRIADGQAPGRCRGPGALGAPKCAGCWAPDTYSSPSPKKPG